MRSWGAWRRAIAGAVTEEKKPSRALQIGRAIAKAAATSGGGLLLGPGGEIAGALVGELVDQAIDFLQEGKRTRIQQFHVELFAGDTPEQQRTRLQRIATDDAAAAEYAAVLEKVAQDDEDEKTAVYARLLRFMQGNSLELPTRKHLIRSVRELAFDDFGVLRRLQTIGGAGPESASSEERNVYFERQMDYAQRGDPLVLAGVQAPDERRFPHAGGRVGWNAHQRDRARALVTLDRRRSVRRRHVFSLRSDAADSLARRLPCPANRKCTGQRAG